MRRLVLSHGHWEAMRAHVQSCSPLEACGLLAGRGDTVEEVLPITNRDQSPTRFRMDPAEQLRAFRRMDERGMDLLGIYHSHPAPPGRVPTPRGEPSATDIEEAAYPAVHVVWSRPHQQWQARGFWIENGLASEVSLRIPDAKEPS